MSTVGSTSWDCPSPTSSPQAKGGRKRTLTAVAAFGWFVVQAVTIGDGSSGLVGDPPNQQVIGDPTTMAVYSIAKIMFVGLALLALAAVDWAWVGKSLHSLWDEVRPV